MSEVDDNVIEAAKAAADPIYGAIEACRAARQFSDAAFATVSDLLNLAEKLYGTADEQRGARQAFVESIIGDEDKYMDHAADMMWAAIDAFTETVPTTVAGLLAMLIYAEEIANRRDCDAFNDTEIFSILATAAETLSGGRHEAGSRTG